MKHIFLIVIFSGFCYAQETNTPAGNIDDLIHTGEPDSNLPEDWDTREPESGKIRMLAEVLLDEAKQEIQNLQVEVPDGEQGKGNGLYVKITQWLQETEQVLIGKTRLELLGMTSLNAEILKLSKSEVDIHESVLDLVGNVQSTTRGMIYNLSDFSEENPNPTEDQLNQMLSCFLQAGFIEESEWEDEQLPIDAAGVFIVDFANSTTKLKMKSLEELNTYLGGDTDNSFFERYEAGGDGMEVLKTKYAANKATIQAKFAEVVAYAAQLEAQQQ